jgi:hypothetical protein
MSRTHCGWPLALITGLALAWPVGAPPAASSPGGGFHGGPAFSAPAIGPNRSVGLPSPLMGAAPLSSAPSLRASPLAPGGLSDHGFNGLGRLPTGRQPYGAGYPLSPRSPFVPGGRPLSGATPLPATPTLGSGTSPRPAAAPTPTTKTSGARTVSGRIDTFASTLLDQSSSMPSQPSDVTPSSAIGQPGVQTPGLPPLSSRLSTSVSTATAGGGTAVPLMPGGGGATLADCMGLWDPATHMSKDEWRQTCQRTAYGIDLAGEPTSDATVNAEPVQGTPRSPHRSSHNAHARHRPRVSQYAALDRYARDRMP